MKCAIIESPFAPQEEMPETFVRAKLNETQGQLFSLTHDELRRFWAKRSIKRHQLYARKLCKWALLHGMAPYASTLLYAHPDVLDDRIPVERKLGIQAGFAWHEVAEIAIVGLNLHVSHGMILGIANHIVAGNEIHFIRLNDGWVRCGALWAVTHYAGGGPDLALLDLTAALAPEHVMAVNDEVAAIRSRA